VPTLDLGADPLPRSIPVALSHPRAARPRPLDGSIPPLNDRTDLFQGVHVKCFPQSLGQSLTQRVEARYLLFWLPPIVPLGTKMWRSVNCGELTRTRFMGGEHRELAVTCQGQTCQTMWRTERLPGREFFCRQPMHIGSVPRAVFGHRGSTC
jgi:hypothetical protein